MKSVSGRAQIIARTAEDLVDTPFRLHGRSPDLGLDCIGLCAHCVAAAGLEADIPNGYALRGGDPGRISRFMQRLGFLEISRSAGEKVTGWQDGRWEVGDIFLARPAPLQLHMLIQAEMGFVHAHAGLRKVVCTPDPPDDRLLRVFRVMEN